MAHEDLKKAVYEAQLIHSQMTHEAPSTAYSRYYTATRHKAANGSDVLHSQPEKDKSSAESQVRHSRNLGRTNDGIFAEGIVYDTILGLIVYHLHATEGQKASQTFLGSERHSLINSIRRDWVELNEQMTVISEQSTPELLAYIEAMRKKLWFLSEMVSPTAPVSADKDMMLPELRKAAIDWLMLATINKQVTRPALEELSDAEVLAECQSLLGYWDRVKKTR